MKTYLLLFILGAIIRVFLFAVTVPGADIANFADTAAIVNAGGNVYTEQYFYNYSPIPALIVGALARLPFAFADSFRIFAAACDLVNAVIVSRLVNWRKVAFALVWLNPALILFGSWDAQFEALTLTPFLFALLILKHSRSVHSRSLAF